MAGLRDAIVTHNFVDLPSNLDIKSLNDAKMNLLSRLESRYKQNHRAKVAKVNRILAAFKNKTIPENLNRRENFWAAKLVLVELNGNGAIKEAL